MDVDTVVDERRRALLCAAAAMLTLAALPFAAHTQEHGKPGLEIGIIGAGRVGGTLGALWVRAGHEVLPSSRHPERL